MSKKTDTFKEELSLIFDNNIKLFTKICLELAPDYFFSDLPSSSSGKYHPIDELSWDGCIIHTKRVVTVALDLCRGLGCENNRDVIISACIIHDLRKQGKTKAGYTLKNHPDLAAQLVAEVYEEFKCISESDFKIIYNSVGFHYGPWSDLKWKKPLSKYTPEELCVYLSDYIASKKTLKVKHNDRYNEV